MKTSNRQILLKTVCNQSLIQENIQYAGTAGISKNNRGQGFVPGFMDTDSGHIYRSRFADGRPAPVHMLSGLPDELFDSNGYANQQHPVKKSVVSGFIRENNFYTREQTAEALRHRH